MAITKLFKVKTVMDTKTRVKQFTFFDFHVTVFEWSNFFVSKFSPISIRGILGFFSTNEFNLNEYKGLKMLENPFRGRKIVLGNDNW